MSISYHPVIKQARTGAVINDKFMAMAIIKSMDLVAKNNKGSSKRRLIYSANAAGYLFVY